MNRIYEEVLKEVESATRKFPTWPTDPLHAIAILGEEFGELTKAVLQVTYEPHKSSLAEVRTEAIQTAAMALRFLASLEQYEYRRVHMHTQESEPKADPPGLDRWCRLCKKFAKDCDCRDSRGHESTPF